VSKSSYAKLKPFDIRRAASLLFCVLIIYLLRRSHICTFYFRVKVFLIHVETEKRDDDLLGRLGLAVTTLLTSTKLPYVGYG